MFNTNPMAPNPFPTAGDPKPPGQMSPQMQAMGQMGQGMAQQGQAEQETMIAKLAAMGPPPPVQMPQAQPVGPGALLAGQGFQQGLAQKLPPLPTKTPGEAMTNPSVGQLLAQGY